MTKLIDINKYIILSLTPGTFKPFDERSEGFTLETITLDNVDDAAERFTEDRVAVFKEKLKLNHIGVFARHNEQVVGYMWIKDYDTDKRVKADGYVPLSGKFSHVHWARVIEDARGKDLQKSMYTWLFRDAFAREIEEIYTDMLTWNYIPLRGAISIGFSERFRLLVIRLKTGHNLSLRYRIKKQ